MTMPRPIHIIPQFPEGRNDQMICGMIGALTTPPSSAWIQWIEDTFEHFNEAPQYGGGSFTENWKKPPKAAGQFNLIRRKLENFIDDPKLVKDYFHIDFSNLASKSLNDSSKIEIDISRSRNMQIKCTPQTIVAFSFRDFRADEVLSVSADIEVRLIEQFAPQYGFVTQYPAAWHWGFPVAGVCWEPSNWNSFEPDNKIYEQRVYRCADRRVYTNPPENGYLREVYTINLINDRHLAAPLNGATLGDYVATHGMLTKNIHGSALHRWHVPDDIIDSVRNDLEHSGLILGSETEPLALPA